MSAVIPGIDVLANYTLFSLNEQASWNYIDENSNFCNRTVTISNTLTNYFDFLQTPGINHQIEGDIETWFLSQGFYISMTVNTNDRNRPLTFSFGPNRTLAINISINCWDGSAPIQEVFYLPSNCNGTCNGCTNIYSAESMVCSSSANVNEVEFMIMIFILLFTQFFAHVPFI